MLARVRVHVAYEVGTMLEALLTHSTLVRPLGAVRALVMSQMR